MSIVRLKPGRPAQYAGLGGTAATRPLALVTDAAPPVDFVAPRPPDGRRHSSDLDLHSNDRISGAQQALEFLDLLAERLQDLRDGVGGDGSAVDANLQRIAACWLERPALTGGTLNGQLEYGSPGAARQRFTVRGLDFESLRASDAVEILNFSIGGKAQREGASVAVQPGLSNAALVNRFDRALAPSGVRARQTAQGALTFDVLESLWSTVRDTFTVMGEGRRFSTGRFSSVRIVGEAPALRPEEWRGDAENLRSTRREAFKALGTVRLARRAVTADLAAAAARLGTDIAAGRDRAAEAAWCSAFTDTFEMAASRPDYPALASVAPALGISRQRVLTVLDSRSTG